jgi:hypothetical protein
MEEEVKEAYEVVKRIDVGRFLFSSWTVVLF